MVSIDKIAVSDTLNDGREKINKAIDGIVNSSGNSITVGFSGTYESLAELKLKYPNGETGTFLVKNADGTYHTYMYQSGNWKDLGIYQGKYLDDKSITKDKLAFQNYDEQESTNLYNPLDKILNGFYHYQTGVFTASATTFSTGLIPVIAGQIMRTNKEPSSVTFYNNSGVFVSGVVSNNFEIPINVKFMRIAILNGWSNDFMVCQSNDPISKYESPKFNDKTLIITNENLDTSISETLDKVDAIKVRSNVVPITIKNGGYYNYQTGAYVADEKYSYVDWFPVSEGEVYFNNKKASGWAFRDSSKNPIAGIIEQSITVPKNVKWASVSLNNYNLENFTITRDTLEIKNEYYTEATVSNTNFLKKISENGITKVEDFVFGGYYNWNTGAFTKSDAHYYLKKMPIAPGSKLTNNKKAYGWSFFDADDNFISGVAAFSTVSPKNVATFSILCVPDDLSTLEITTDDPQYNKYEFIDSIVLPESNFIESKAKNISILGDSISTFAGVSLVSNAFYPKGDVLENSHTWWGDIVKDRLLVNNSIGGSDVVVSGESRADKLHSGEVKPDTIIFYMGINDWYHNKTLTEFKAAYENCVIKMMNTYPSAAVNCCTLQYSAIYIQQADKNTNGNTVQQFNAIIKDIAETYALNVIDFYSCGVNKTNYTSLLIDYTHPNASQMKKMYNKALNNFI